jgi:hypothetical protein
MNTDKSAQTQAGEQKHTKVNLEARGGTRRHAEAHRSKCKQMLTKANASKCLQKQMQALKST